MSDRNFDDLAGRFANNIYDNPKGQLRLQLVRDELLACCPQLAAGRPLRVLDAGCGLGQMTAVVAALGHRVVSCDLSQAMLAEAQLAVAATNPDLLTNVQFIHSSLQALDSHLAHEPFDIVIFHAVLEWMEEPREGLQSLLRWLAPGGTLSLMFYNLHSLVFKNLLRGNFRKLDDKDFRGDPGGLTPISPLDPADVESWLAEAGLTLFGKRGIRSFYDYMDHAMQHKKLAIPLDEIVRMEKHYGTQEPYRSLARYLLLHYKKDIKCQGVPE